MHMLIDQFLRFEQDEALYDARIKGVKFWSIIRERVYNLILYNKENIGIAHTKFRDKQNTKKITILISLILNSITRNPYLVGNKEILFINHPRRVYDGKYYNCLYTDKIIERINYSYCVLEIADSGEHKVPVKTQNLKYADALDLKFYFLYYINLLMKKHNLNDSHVEYLVHLVIKINKYFDIEINQKEFIDIVEKSILMHDISCKIYSKLLIKIKPKLIIEVNGYERRRKAINSVAKLLNIPTIELQHGTMGKYHEAYNFEKKMDLSTFPDYIFSYGQLWKDDTRFPIREDRFKVVGWPYYEKKVKDFKKNIIKEKKTTILFISQGTIGKELSKRAVELSRIMDKDEYKIIYKLHPGEYSRWKNEYPWLVNDDFQIVDNNDHDMHYYFAKSDIQIGVCSTALFEGLGHELITIIVRLHGYETMMALYEKAGTYLVDSADEILSICENSKGQKCDYDVSYFWSQNSMNNIINEIDKIIKMRDEE
ncbi:MAG: hypothetical protein K0R93_592 [Anaerosolibacter sp.]|uniref:hypothetical protein n=1 Tax=Anaerosolibacter sp. TaxID=1872527 RepID=UPI0026122769|nr:hypothetical protein [Anaerosolibacter sp.]MDF2545694.1 hypothetical protein [Anaerosolibacter sp.]